MLTKAHSYNNIIVSLEYAEHGKIDLDLIAKYPEYEDRDAFLETWLAGGIVC